MVCRNHNNYALAKRVRLSKKVRFIPTEKSYLLKAL